MVTSTSEPGIAIIALHFIRATILYVQYLLIVCVGVRVFVSATVCDTNGKKLYQCYRGKKQELCLYPKKLPMSTTDNRGMMSFGSI